MDGNREHPRPEQYPHLFAETIWPWEPVRVSFELFSAPPPGNMIANVNIVPYVGDQWLIIRLADGSWEIPGGTLEPNEDYVATAHRELREEAGAQLGAFKVFGGWRCFSLAAKPYRPHLPFPEYYRVVGLGNVDVVQRPENPADGEQVVAVEKVSLETAMECFGACDRPDLAELYHLAANLSSGILG